MRTGDLYQRYYGVFIGTVLDVEDPEKLGRVRIECDQFEDAEDNVFWANVARPAAGNKTGVFFTPKVGDQVIIGYLAGDVNEPLILGYAHSQKRPPPSPVVSTKKHAVVTDIGYVVFDEEDGLIEVRLNAPESFIKLDKEGITISAPKVKIESTGVASAGVEIVSQVSPIQINAVMPVQLMSGTGIGLSAPVLGFGGTPSFVTFPGVPGGLGSPLALDPPSDGPAKFDFSTIGMEITTGDKELCVNERGVLLRGFAESLFNEHTHNTSDDKPDRKLDSATITTFSLDEDALVTKCTGGGP